MNKITFQKEIDFKKQLEDTDYNNNKIIYHQLYMFGFIPYILEDNSQIIETLNVFSEIPFLSNDLMFLTSLKNSKNCFLKISDYKLAFEDLVEDNPESFIIIPVFFKNTLQSLLIRKTNNSFSIVNIDKNKKIAFKEFLFEKFQIDFISNNLNLIDNLTSSASKTFNLDILEENFDTLYHNNVIEAIKFAYSTKDFNFQQLKTLRYTLYDKIVDNRVYYNINFKISKKELHKSLTTQLSKKHPNLKWILEKNLKSFIKNNEFRYFISIGYSPKLSLLSSFGANSEVKNASANEFLKSSLGKLDLVSFINNFTAIINTVVSSDKRNEFIDLVKDLDISLLDANNSLNKINNLINGKNNIILNNLKNLYYLVFSNRSAEDIYKQNLATEIENIQNSSQFLKDAIEKSEIIAPEAMKNLRFQLCNSFTSTAKDILDNLGEEDFIIKLCETAIWLNPQYYIPYFLKGCAELKLLNLKEAINELSTSLKFYPENIKALLYRAIALLKNGDIKKALLDYDRSIELMKLKNINLDFDIFIQQGLDINAIEIEKNKQIKEKSQLLIKERRHALIEKRKDLNVFVNKIDLYKMKDPLIKKLYQTDFITSN